MTKPRFPGCLYPFCQCELMSEKSEPALGDNDNVKQKSPCLDPEEVRGVFAEPWHTKKKKFRLQ